MHLKEMLFLKNQNCSIFAILARIGDLWPSGVTVATVGQMKVVGARRDRAGVNKQVVYFLLSQNFIFFHLKYLRPFLFTPCTGQGKSVGELKLAPLAEQLESESKLMCSKLEPLRLVAQHFSPCSKVATC